MNIPTQNKPLTPTPPLGGGGATGTILLTGGAGFIGNSILQQLNANGIDNVIVVDNLNHNEKKQNLSNCKYSLYYDKNLFLSILPTLNNVTAILHQGACSSTTEANADYLQYNNVAYSKALLHYAIDHNIPFIYASSASVYGNGALGFNDVSNNYQPINGYAHSKLEFDKYVTAIIATQQPTNKIIGLRYFNVYGYGEAHKGTMASVVYKFYQQYLRTKTIQLFEGSNAILRDFVHVDDVVAVNLFCLQHYVPSGIYNVGTGKAESFVALANAFTHTITDAKLEYIPFPILLKNKYQYFTEATIEKLKAVGYTIPFKTVAQGVQQYCEMLLKK